MLRTGRYVNLEKSKERLQRVQKQANFRELADWLYVAPLGATNVTLAAFIAHVAQLDRAAAS